MFRNLSTMLVVLFLLSCQSPQKVESLQESTLSFGEKDLSLEDIKKIVSPVSYKVIEVHVKQPVEFLAFPLIELLNSQLGKAWQKSDGILFTALDGYRSDVAVEKILKYKPFLAYSFAEKNKAFKFDNLIQNEKDVEFGPFYLIWENINNPELIRYGAYNWPYQIARIDSISYASYYAKAFPIKNPSADHKKGFDLFKTYCMSCHSVSGDEGGAKGPVLYPNPAVVKKGYTYFKKWVQSPSSMLPGTTMYPLNPELTQKEKDSVTALLYKYLIALNKQ